MPVMWRKKVTLAFLPFDPVLPFCLCRVPSNCAQFSPWLIHIVSHSSFLLPLPESPPSHPGSVLCLLETQPFVTAFLELHGLTCPSLLCVLPVLTISCRALEGHFSALLFVFTCLCLASVEIMNRIALFFTFLISLRIASIIS